MEFFLARITTARTLNSLFFCLLFTSSSLASTSEINDENSVNNTKEHLSKSYSSDSHKKSIMTAIRDHYTPPITFAREPVKAIIRLDKTGRVIAVSAIGSSEQVNQAVMSAIREASPLPIDLDNPDNYSQIVIQFTMPKSVL
ncbi:MAG: TonB C-terminal domain-containing protein [Psychrobacter sp.]|uniref:TonB C-terminal domain-containing protein n=1 Tax=Psychrobacter sp. AOP7-B1-24 TaxID=3457645 RepID=UPI003FB90464